MGPITALAIEAFAPPMETFRSGRDLPRGWGLCHGNIHRVVSNGLAGHRRPAG
ncbi:hypothetical protein IVA78_26700 [Bradyrhizobium sp. 137]|nr:hypothetical protein [Bradyrhizobium sp. 137]